MKENASDKRNSSIELLRILLILGVIQIHYNVAGIGNGFRYLKVGTVNQIYSLIVHAICINAVSIFVMISGYYLVNTNKRKLSKVYELMIQSLIFVAIQYLFTQKRNYDYFTMLWFPILYCILYVISPYINLIIEKCTKKQLRTIIIVLIALFSIEPMLIDYIQSFTGETLYGISCIGYFGSNWGYTEINFILLYIIGAYIRKYGISLKKFKKITYLMLSISGIVLMSILECEFSKAGIVTWNYDNPLIIISAALVLDMFTSIQFYNKGVNELAKASFTVYLFHFYFIINWVSIQEFINQPIYLLILHQICVATSLYLIGYIAYKIWNILTKKLFSKLVPVINKINISLH